MDNLEDSLPMESIENMDFDHSVAVVNQEDITLDDSSQGSDMPMDLDNINDEPILLDGGSEEIIVSDFIGDQFGFQEYTMQSDNSSGANITIDANQLIAQNEHVNLQFAESKASTSQTNLITIKAIPQSGVKKTANPATYPRQVAIAPKPIKSTPNIQYSIAPKPIAVMMNKNANLTKAVPVKNVQGLKGNTVLAQIGKQLVMMPAGAAGQKIKLSSIVPSSSSDPNIQFAQLISNKGNKSIRTKFIVQAQPSTDSNQPAVITKLVSVGGAPAQARYVMQQKTVPISIAGSKVVLTSSSKPGVKVAPKKQIISIKSQSPKVITSRANVQTKKVVITANPPQTQNVILKTTGVKTATQIVKKDTAGQSTQIHPINVPGKGIQFIKLLTNQPATAAQKVTAAKGKASTLALSGLAGKNFVWTDNKGNIIHMTAEKVSSGQPPPLLVATSAASGAKVVPKTTKKLVRIAPITHTSDTPSAKVREASKMAYCLQPKQPRASQSLLISQEGTSVSLEEFNEMVDQNNFTSFGTLAADLAPAQGYGSQTDVKPQLEQVDIKPTLVSLISEAVAGEENVHEISNMEEIEIEYDNTPHKQEIFEEDENSNSMGLERADEKLIIVPSNVRSNSARAHEDHMYQDDTNNSMEDDKQPTVVSCEADVMPYLSPEVEQSFSDSAFVFDGKTEPNLRPRKACNCTKSQCLKLYCDCFANGEFCNKCNCNNCHNNLENEELRQKAIRACLERNPNAFRPKIGKGKTGGPEIIRRHNKGCNCKRSGCLKNYCECYEAKIACTLMCKCVGCRNIEETLERRRDAVRLRDKLTDSSYRQPLPIGQMKQPCSFMTPEVIEAVAKCMLATATCGGEGGGEGGLPPDPVEDILLEFSRCMGDIINASHQAI